MPLEISEIGVHIAVGAGAPSGAAAEHGAGAGASSDPEGGGSLTQAHIDQIVSACVSQVMRTLRQREER